ncbi:MAG TPA: MFS transporter [Nocardioidaceae bacterium]|nr:MFS transporter [Nocardioidaceae bacterium]
MAQSLQTATIETRVPSRLDRLPWSKFHWKVVIGLGTVWILDGLEVTMVGSVAARLTEEGSGIEITAGQIGIAAAIYIIGACLGALFFGQLTDRLGRKKLFLVTLLVYILATVATAFSFAPWYFYLARFFTGAGIGGEYAAINSAIDELIPARVRGRVDLIINGSYWLGAAAGALLAALVFLNTAIFPTNIGWRVAFAVGAVLGLAILIVRRHVPESPRWLFIHGREDEAERIVDGIEQEVREETGEDLAEAEDSLTVRQREAIPFREIAKVAFKIYPKRAVLGLALFVGQAFIYNGVTFNLGTLMSTFFGVASGVVPYFIAIWALSNFAGPVILGRLFDTVGRKPMISGAYLGSALLTVPLAIFMISGSLNRWTFLALIMGIFFLASSGASAAYLTVSEIFPMETRALAIAFFYAVGTAAGGIAGPLLFGQLIATENSSYVALAFLIGAAVMALGGVAEIFLGVRAERANLEDIARPLTAEDAEEAPSGESGQDEGEATPGRQQGGQPSGRERDAQRCREDAERARAEAAGHRADALELRTAADAGDGPAADRMYAEEVLADIADLRAQALDEQAAAHLLHAEADSTEGHSAAACQHRARAAQLRADGLTARQQALGAHDPAGAERHGELAEAAEQRARASEQRALAEQARAAAETDNASVEQARAEMHESWSRMHEALAQVHAARAEGDSSAADAAEREATEVEQLALAAEERLAGSEHLSAAQELGGDLEKSEVQDAQAEDQARRAADLEQRVRERAARRRSRERSGLRRFRPGPSAPISSGRTGGIDPARAAGAERALDQEIEVIARALTEHGATERQELARLVGARYWGPGRFGAALGAALDEGRARRVSRRAYGPPNGTDDNG